MVQKIGPENKELFSGPIKKHSKVIRASYNNLHCQISILMPHQRRIPPPGIPVKKECQVEELGVEPKNYVGSQD